MNQELPECLWALRKSQLHCQAPQQSQAVSDRDPKRFNNLDSFSHSKTMLTWSPATSTDGLHAMSFSSLREEKRVAMTSLERQRNYRRRQKEAKLQARLALGDGQGQETRAMTSTERSRKQRQRKREALLRARTIPQPGVNQQSQQGVSSITSSTCRFSGSEDSGEQVGERTPLAYVESESQSQQSQGEARIDGQSWKESEVELRVHNGGPSTFFNSDRLSASDKLKGLPRSRTEQETTDGARKFHPTPNDVTYIVIRRESGGIIVLRDTSKLMAANEMPDSDELEEPPRKRAMTGTERMRKFRERHREARLHHQVFPSPEKNVQHAGTNFDPVAETPSTTHTYALPTSSAEHQFSARDEPRNSPGNGSSLINPAEVRTICQIKEEPQIDDQDGQGSEALFQIKCEPLSVPCEAHRSSAPGEEGKLLEERSVPSSSETPQMLLQIQEQTPSSFQEVQPTGTDSRPIDDIPSMPCAETLVFVLDEQDEPPRWETSTTNGERVSQLWQGQNDPLSNNQSFQQSAADFEFRTPSPSSAAHQLPALIEFEEPTSAERVEGFHQGEKEAPSETEINQQSPVKLELHDSFPLALPTIHQTSALVNCEPPPEKRTPMTGAERARRFRQRREEARLRIQNESEEMPERGAQLMSTERVERFHQGEKEAPSQTEINQQSLFESELHDSFPLALPTIHQTSALVNCEPPPEKRIPMTGAERARRYRQRREEARLRVQNESEEMPEKGAQLTSTERVRRFSIRQEEARLKIQNESVEIPKKRAPMTSTERGRRFRQRQRGASPEIRTVQQSNARFPFLDDVLSPSSSAYTSSAPDEYEEPPGKQTPLTNLGRVGTFRQFHDGVPAASATERPISASIEFGDPSEKHTAVTNVEATRNLRRRQREC